MNQYNIDVTGAGFHPRTGHLKMKGTSPDGNVIDFSNISMLYNGKPFFSISGEFHYGRYNCEQWENEILKMKACGLDTVATYMFWNYHEFEEGVFDFSGNNDIRRFVELCAKHGMWVILRIGPYAHGECRNGGLPDWLFGRPFEVRSNDPEYLAYVERYFNEIGKQVSDLMFTKGGPVIAVQLENEYMAACSPWEITVTQNREWITHGNGGLEHMEHLQELAEKAGLKTAFYTCTGWGDAPYVDGEMLPLWGGYAYWPWIFWDGADCCEHPATYGYRFENKHDENAYDGFSKKYPFACCEMGGGMQVWYPYRFVVEPESVEAMSLVTVAGGCNFLGYFMFHGGQNQVIENVFMNEQLNPRISYDFQAPIGESGQTKESYKRIKLLHYMYRDLNDFLCEAGPVIPEGQDSMEATDVETLRYAARSDGSEGVLFVNNYQDHATCTEKKDIQFKIATENGEICFPKNHGLTFKTGVSAAFPFHMDLEGIRLEYSTAQYIAKVEGENEAAYFFFVHPEIEGEFCFTGCYKIEGADAVTEAGKTFVYMRDKMFVTYNENGKRIRFFCLSRKESLDFHRIEIGNRNYAIISKGNVFADKDEIVFETINTSEQEVLIYPKPQTTEETVEYIGEQDGLYTYRFRQNIPVHQVEVIKKYENRAVINFDRKLIDQVSELYLNIDYTGDIGWAFIDGKLIHDDFNNGTTWVIALKKFKDRLKDGQLYLYLSEPPAGNVVTVQGESTYAKVSQQGEKHACFHNIWLTVQMEKRMRISK